MTETLVALIVDESKWLTVSMTLAVLMVIFLVFRHRNSAFPNQRRVMAAMNMFFGTMIGAMAFGHLLAVTTKLLTGTLEGSVALFYAIGVALAAPAWWLILHSLQMVVSTEDDGRKTLGLNAWLTVTLLALGLHNLPLAAAGFFNIGYRLQSGRVLGWAIVGLAVVVNVGLFVGSVIFFASGQSFEQFQGMQ